MSDTDVMVREDRHTFFAEVRASVFGGHLTQEQVDGTNAVLDEWEAGFPQGGDLRKLGYILSTTWWETGRRMIPVHEGGRGVGHAYGRPDPQTGQAYYGRGQVQLTWKTNYAKLSKIVGVDLVGNPDKALDPKVSAKVLIQGMLRGLFTGKRLSSYFTNSGADWAGARRVVNGTDHAHDIAAVAQRFHAALVKARQELPAPPMPQPREERDTSMISIDTSRLPPAGKIAAAAGFLGGLAATFGMPEAAKLLGLVNEGNLQVVYQFVGVAGSVVAVIAGLLPNSKPAA
jgi:putative chitinase